MDKIMKKGKILLIALLLVLSASAFACRDKTPPKPDGITLSFDKADAYFTSQIALHPIAGDLPAAGDAYEEKTVALSASKAVKMRLTAGFEGGAVPGLMASVNGGTAVSFTSGAELYASAQAETEVTLNVKIFLAKTAGVDSADKTLTFSLSLSYFQDR